jgi:hypothetical protein
MAYWTILVNIDIDCAPAPLVRLAADLAGYFNAHLMGFSAAEVPMPLVMADGAVFDGEAMRRQREDIERSLDKLDAAFWSLAGTVSGKEWRGALGDPTRLLVEAARAADLIVTGSPEGASPADTLRAVDLGSLVLQAGRPVLIAASGADRVIAHNALIAWKDTREARRAVADALPLLALAKDVRLVTVANDAHTGPGRALPMSRPSCRDMASRPMPRYFPKTPSPGRFPSWRK